MRKGVLVALLLAAAAIAAWLLFGPTRDSRAGAERGHGIELPPSAAHIQCRGDEWHRFLDRGIVTMFEMSSNDLPLFVAQLKIRSRNGPVQPRGDPTENGYSVWPQRSSTFVPGNSVNEGLKRTWQGEALPVEMLSCSSRTGDWLHLELWSVASGTVVVKMYTDWN